MMPRPFLLRLLVTCGLAALLPAAAIAATAAPLDLKTYRETNQVIVATLAVEVIPARSLRIKAPAGGELHLNLPGQRSGALIPAGTLWGEFDPERVKLEREAVTLARTLLDKKQQPKAALDLAREAADLAERHSELVRQTDMLKRINAEPELARLYHADAASTDAPPPEITALIARLQTQTTLIHDVLDFAGTAEDQRLEARALDLKLIQQETDLHQRETEKRLVMPFDGELTFIPRLPPEGRPLRVQLGEDLALIQDFSVIQARLVMKRPDWRLIPSESLHLRIHAGIRPLLASFSHGRLEEINGREERVDYFVFSPDDRVAARSLVGGGLNALLIAELATPARLVPKLDLVLAYPEAFREGDWTTGLATALPGARLLVIGETQLAITPAP